MIMLADFYGCNHCDDCGPSSNYPYVNVKFYNIDSLTKINDSIAVLNDSINTLNNLVNQGADSLAPVVAALEKNLTSVSAIQGVINSAKIKIDSLAAKDAGNVLYFTDSITHDSLTSFHFPLKMTDGNSEFIITLAGRKDTLGLNYQLISLANGSNIIVQAYDLSIYKSTFDSVNLVCRKDSCFSNDITLKIYF